MIVEYLSEHHCAVGQLAELLPVSPLDVSQSGCVAQGGRTYGLRRERGARPREW